jgi:hypothetical protein
MDGVTAGTMGNFPGLFKGDGKSIFLPLLFMDFWRKILPETSKECNLINTLSQ